MKFLLLTTFAIFHFVSFGQEIDKKIRKVKTAKLANGFIKENPILNVELVEFNSKKAIAQPQMLYFIQLIPYKTRIRILYLYFVSLISYYLKYV